MQHSKSFKKLNRTKDQRAALLKSLAGALVQHEKIETTEAKAKELRGFIEKLITRACRGDIASRRLLVNRLGNDKAVKKLIDEIAPKYKERKGGYTRVIKLPKRGGDAAKMAIIEFV
jgi:large subunit ribosomal protein L17